MANARLTLWQRWIQKGVERATTPDEAKRIRLLNSISPPSILCICILSLMHLRGGAIAALMTHLGAACLIGIGNVLGRHGHFKIGRSVFFMAGLVLPVGGHLVYGNSVFAYMTLFPNVAMVFLLYRPSEKISRILPIFFIAIVASVHRWGYLLVEPQTYPTIANFYTALVLNCTVMMLCFRWFQSENALAEAVLASERDHLSFLNDALAHSKMALERRNAEAEERTRELADLNFKLEEARVRAENANAFKGKFLAKVSHELRTPMNGALGMAQLLQDTSLTEDQRELSQMILASGQQQLSILNNLLDFAKIEAGKVTIEQHEFSLHEALRAIARGFELQCGQKKVQFIFELSADVPRQVRGDSVKINQVLLNLLSNALKFTTAGSVKLRVFASNDMTSFQLTDSGIGMTESQLASLFTPFQQADDSIARRFGGTGLGLSIVHELVTLMSGTIKVQSSPGSGTVFHVNLPLKIVSESAPETVPTGTDVFDVPRGIRILVAEDNDTNVMVMRRLLQKVGADVTFVSDGDLATEAEADNSFDIIFMDLHMPRMGGIDAGRVIRTREQRVGRDPTPIYALSADVQSDVIKECTDAGFDGFIEKPIKKDVLYRTLTHIAQTKHQRLKKVV